MPKLTNNSVKETIAIFDFDDTLTRKDSFFPFLRMIAGNLKFSLGLLLLSPILTAYIFCLIPNYLAKEKFLTYFLKGITEDKLKHLGEIFAETQVPKLLKNEAKERLKYHQDQGHYIVVISASLEDYLVPWAMKMGIDEVLGTKLHLDENRVITGKIQGKNCYGQEKVNRLQAVFDDLSQYTTYVYGDSKGDREMLAIATYPYYRKFSEEKSTITDNTKIPNWEKGLILSVIVAVSLYLGLILWSGVGQFWESLKSLPIWLIPSLLLIIFFGYCLRFLRWNWYLKEMKYNNIPWQSNFRIFLASFALTASPGKAGESIKSLLLKRRYQIPIAPTLAALFCERFTDALSVVILVCLGLVSMIQGNQNQIAIITLAIIQISIILVLQRPHLLQRYLLIPLSRINKLKPITDKLDTLLSSASVLLQPKLLVGSTMIALIAWGLEGVALFYLFQYLGAESITIYQAVLIHTASGLIGALSMLPGGIGGAEAATISFALLYGATKAQAITATFIIRLLTLWFAVFIGIIALLIDYQISE